MHDADVSSEYDPEGATLEVLLEAAAKGLEPQDQQPVNA